MNIFGKRKTEKYKGRYSISISQEGYCIAKADVSVDKKPALEICEFSLWAKGVPDEKQVWEKIKELDLGANACTAVLDIGEYKLLNVEAPEVPEEEVASAVRWQIGDMVDFDVTDAVIDVFESPIPGGPNKPNNIYVVAASHEKILERTGFLQNAEVQLTAIDIPELALRNLASFLPENKEGVAFLYMMRGEGMMILIRDSYIYLARRLDIGLDYLMQINDGSGQQDPSVAQEDNPQMESLVLEMLRTIDYYDRYFSLTPLSGLVITPMETELPGFQESLARKLGFNVRYLDINEMMDCKTPISKTLQEKAFFAIGAALRMDQEEDEGKEQGEEELEVAQG